MNKRILLASVLASALGAAVVAPAQAADREACYGIAKAGQNDCKGNGHACAGQSTKDKDAGEFKLVPSGTCQKMGGSLKAM